MEDKALKVPKIELVEDIDDEKRKQLVLLAQLEKEVLAIVDEQKSPKVFAMLQKEVATSDPTRISREESSYSPGTSSPQVGSGSVEPSISKDTSKLLSSPDTKELQSFATGRSLLTQSNKILKNPTYEPRISLHESAIIPNHAKRSEKDEDLLLLYDTSKEQV